MSNLATLDQGGSITHSPEIDVGALLSEIVAKGVTADAAGAVKELVLLHEHRQDREKKQTFLEAFARVRYKLKTVNATKGIPDKQGHIKWFYAPLEDLQDEVEPILESEGFTIRFDSRREGALCIGICWLSHITGHEEKSECAVNATNAQGGDLGAFKMSKRGALTAMLGIKTRHLGDEASMLGDKISLEQVESLKKRVEATRSDVAKFLKLAMADTFENIRIGKYAVLDGILLKKEKQTGAVPMPAPTGGTGNVRPEPAAPVSK